LLLKPVDATKGCSCWTWKLGITREALCEVGHESSPTDTLVTKLACRERHSGPFGSRGVGALCGSTPWQPEARQSDHLEVLERLVVVHKLVVIIDKLEYTSLEATLRDVAAARAQPPAVPAAMVRSHRKGHLSETSARMAVAVEIPFERSL